MKGLLLIGGKSSRMGKDKSTLSFHDGHTQKQRGIALLQSVCDEVFLSVGADSDHEENAIVDAFGPVGPLGAIASAQQAHPDSTWLILACDLPLLEQQHLETLASSHSDAHPATYFTSAIDSQPEPLCAIWDRGSAQAVSEAIATKQFCPRKVLNNINGQALTSLDPWALANTNTPADVLEVKARLDNNLQEKTLTISYYAQLRELTGVQSEQHTTTSVTPAGVFEEIRIKHNISLKRKNMMIAINGEFTDWTHQVLDGEELVFIPPVAGG